MKTAAKPLSKLTGVNVIVEERLVSLEVGAGSWRTHAFSSLETVPERLPPVFKKDHGSLDLELLDMVRQACAAGRREVRLEAPYTADPKWNQCSVLRTVTLKLQYEPKPARAPVRARGPAHVAMPMFHDGVWSTFELQRVEQELAARYTKLPLPLISLSVRLAKLDLRPVAGRDRLCRAASAILERRRA